MKYLLICLLCIMPCFAETNTAPQPTAKEKALEKLFSDIKPEELPQALENARKAGVHPQVILEAHFLSLVDQEDFHAIAPTRPRITQVPRQILPRQL